MQTRSAEPIDRCVIWTPRGRHAPEELVGVLEKRGFHIAHAASAHEAVGELCALAREGFVGHIGRPEDEIPATRPRIIVLIVTEPTNLDHLSAAYSAASEYTPRLDARVVCWWFDEASRRLRAADTSDLARWCAGPGIVVKPGAGKALIERGLGGAGARAGAVENSGVDAGHPLEHDMGDHPARAPGAVPSAAPAARLAPISPGVAKQADDVTEAFLGKGRPSLRLAGEGTLPPGPEESENPRPGDIPNPTGGMGGMLTGEELAMLLDPDPPGRAFRTE